MIYKHIIELSDNVQRKVINRLLDFYYENKSDLNMTIDVFLLESLNNRLIDLEDTIYISDLI